MANPKPNRKFGLGSRKLTLPKTMGVGSVYLVHKVGRPLIQCLAELAIHRPVDPIEWIAHWLYKYSDNELFFYEKSIFLKEIHRMGMEMQRDSETRQSVKQELNEEIYGLKRILRESRKDMKDCGKKVLQRLLWQWQRQTFQNHLQRMDDKGRRSTKLHGDHHHHHHHHHHHGHHHHHLRENLTEWEKDLSELKDGEEDQDHLEEGAVKKKSLPRPPRPPPGKPKPGAPKRHHHLIKKKKTQADAQSHGSHLQAAAAADPKVQVISLPFQLEDPDHMTRQEYKQLKSVLQRFSIKLPPSMNYEVLNNDPSRLKTMMNVLVSVGEACWNLDGRASLVCNHSVLGEMKPRPTFVPPETPEWWETMGYSEHTLYDHEIYSTDTTARNSAEDLVHSFIPRLSYRDYFPLARGEEERKIVESSKGKRVSFG